MEYFKQYTWETDSKAEVWRHAIFKTKKECIDDYLKYQSTYSDYSEPRSTIFIAEAVPYTVSIDARDILERLSEQAYDEYGECAENWYPQDNKPKKALDELSDGITSLVTKWLEKYNDTPCFYHITNVKEVSVK